MIVKFVRHGETDLNSPIRRIQGISDYELNANGIKQAKITRDKLSNENFDIIITSPLKRARQTAEIINQFKKIDIIVDDRIIERNYGKLEGEIVNTAYCNLDYDFESVGGESMKAYKARLKDFISDVKKKYYNKRVLVVGHNGVISVISCILEGDPENNNFENRGIGNGEIKEFDF